MICKKIIISKKAERVSNYNFLWDRLTNLIDLNSYLEKRQYRIKKYMSTHIWNNFCSLQILDDDHDGVVKTKDGPEPRMRTSWMQLPRLEKNHIGTYYCIASNSVGEASISSFLSIT